MNPKLIGVLAGIALVAVLFWPAGSSQKVKTLYEEAKTLYENKDYNGAIEKYNLALEEAQKRFVKTDVIDKDFNTLAKYQIAVCYSKLAEEGDIANYDKALEIIEEIYPTATVRKHQEGIVYLWGHILFKKEQYEEAEPKFRELIEKFPNSLFVENSWYAIGRLNFQLQKYEDSRKAYKAVLDNFPNSDFKDDAQHLIAQSYLLEENYDQAFAEFDRLNTEEYKNYPDLQAEASYKAAYSLKQLGRDDEAITRYNTFVTEYPGSDYVTAAYFDLGTIYAKQKDYDNARQNYELALQNTNDLGLRAEIQNEIGRNYYEQEDYQNAIVAYQKLLDPEQNPEGLHLLEAKIGIADSNFKLQNWTEAIPAYQRLINEHPDETAYIPYSTFQIGEAYYQQKEYENSLAWYQKVLDNYPDDDIAPHALYGAIWSLSELGRDDEVQAVGANFIAQKKEDPDFDLQAAEIQMKLGDIQLKMEKYSRAAEEYAKVWDEYQDLPKFFLLKLISKFQEGTSYFNAAKPSGYEETDQDAVFDEALLQKSTAAYKQAIDKFGDKYDPASYGNFDFDERLQYIESCQMNLALAYEKLKEYQSAREVYAQIPRQSENYERVQLLIAQTYAYEDKRSEAIDAYQQVLNDATISTDSKDLARIKLADLQRADKRYAEAAISYEQIIAANPKGEYADDAQYLVGVCYYQIEEKNPQDLNKAIAAFQKMIDDYPNSSNLDDAYYGITLAYRDLAEKVDAAYWAKIIEVADTATAAMGSSEDEKVLETLNNINLVKIRALEESTGAEESVDAMTEVLHKVVDSPVASLDAKANAQLKMGHLLYEVKRYQDAISAYEKLLQIAPNHESVPTAQYQIAVCNFQLGQTATEDTEKQQYFQASVQASQAALQGNLDADMSLSVYYALGLAKAGLQDKPGAIEAFQQVISLAEQVRDERRQASVYDSHTRLAELYLDQGQYEPAIQEYEYIINHSQDKETQARSYFSIALAYDEHLQNYDKAIANYKSALPLTDDFLTKAQATYRIGLLYATKLKDEENALQSFDELINNYSNTNNETIKSMIADAKTRRAELYVNLGMLDEAISELEKARDEAVASTGTSLILKLGAQYNLALYQFQRARTFYNEEEKAYNEDYRNGSRQAIDSYLQVHAMAEEDMKAKGKTIKDLPQDAIPFVKYALFQGAQIAYTIHFKPDLEKMIPALELFVKYTDQGLFGDAKTDKELGGFLQEALTFLGSGYFDLARYSNNDPQLFTKAKDIFKDLVRRYPNAEDAARWQYQAGETYFAMEDYRNALAEYEKVGLINPQHASAADALYAMATCYQYIAAETADPVKKQELEQKVFDLNEQLANQYPNSEYAADAFINVANNYYNQAVTVTDREQQKDLYKRAIDLYRRAIDLPGIKAESKMIAEDFLRETENGLAIELYSDGNRLMLEARQLKEGSDERKQKLSEVITILEGLTRDYPNTPSADIAYDVIGDAYVELEQWDKALKAFETLINKYPPNKPPVNNDVANAWKYAQSRYASIATYLQSLDIHKSTTGGE
ncbi:TPA: tetratricopeptide repeat protein [Candidatus Poribacteria bacterium]|nr:tetratricopeptide repeat protein [Candidatus Poribacteria bacterium]